MILTIRRASPVAAEGSVERDSMLLEERLGIAAVAGPRRLEELARPSTGVRVALQISGLLPTGETPDLDPRARPLHSVRAATGLVERGAVARLGVVDERAAVVRALGRPARRVRDGRRQRVDFEALGRGAGGVDLAAWSGVHGVLVLHVVVHALDDVDLAVIGPVLADSPEGGPGSQLSKCQARHREKRCHMKEERC